MTHTSVVWFRNDLRVHDHAPLHHAGQQATRLICLYCLDPRQFGKTQWGFPKTGAFRAQFLLESLQDLRQSLQSLGSNLWIYRGCPEEVIPNLVAQTGATQVLFHREVTDEEVRVERALQRALQPLKVGYLRFWGSTLYHPQDLPLKIRDIPEVFTQFRQQVERHSRIAEMLPPPTQLPAGPDLAPGPIPDLTDLGLTPPPVDPRSQFIFKGGETAGKARMQDYIWTLDRLRVYKQTRNGMLNPHDASRFSPWLALGCLSPRSVFQQIQQYEQERIQNDSTYWLYFELLWRDYFRFICAKHGNQIFQIEGLRGLKIPWKQDRQLFQAWAAGKTGYPLIDANMRELAATGFMSNRGRQNVASFLTKNLGLNWQLGAEWFESLLIDYDVCSNWGNWNYTAGVGNDARGFRFFNVFKQAQDYDPQGDYVKHWIPELAQVPAAKVHALSKLQPVDQQRFGVQVGKDYPEPLVDLWQSAKANEKVYEQARRSESRRSSRGQGVPRSQSASRSR
ncbi:DASH family cryptochrome [Lyngbya confervoides]|uniref:Cryptochrome DASH n=1 Tax=Lyngbya confervoides BDU141951 TaxID=1574623 RepID=A0ABD4T3A5_9CYAN|nr:DASH family cryptochrome [Lyngbya confervoides]MCM1983301.1 DASH family cryptochrome [Lyngbya confervoides BDU141951]